MRDVVRPVPVAVHEVLDLDAAEKLLLEQVALVQEEHDADVLQELVLDHALPEKEGVL